FSILLHRRNAPVSSAESYMFKALDRVFTRILVLAILALGSLAALATFVINESRNNLYEQKKTDVRHVVESAVSMVAAYDKRAAAGEMTREQAQAEAKKSINAVRYQGNEYIFVMDFGGNYMVHPAKPENVGKNAINLKDPYGKFFIQDFIATAKA